MDTSYSKLITKLLIILLYTGFAISSASTLFGKIIKNHFSFVAKYKLLIFNYLFW